MTVADLIKRLAAMPQEAKVTILYDMHCILDTDCTLTHPEDDGVIYLTDESNAALSVTYGGFKRL